MNIEVTHILTLYSICKIQYFPFGVYSKYLWKKLCLYIEPQITLIHKYKLFNMANGHKSLRLGKHCVNADFDIYGKIEMDERKKTKNIYYKRL